MGKCELLLPNHQLDLFVGRANYAVKIPFWITQKPNHDMMCFLGWGDMSWYICLLPPFVSMAMGPHRCPGDELEKHWASWQIVVINLVPVMKRQKNLPFKRKLITCFCFPSIAIYCDESTFFFGCQVSPICFSHTVASPLIWINHFFDNAFMIEAGKGLKSVGKSSM